ncbi:MAG: TonB-dependent receptor [Paludibacteraceae bacterium]|nr:TonB-dependent receptor [Paludibacteraceae bacterium]
MRKALLAILLLLPLLHASAAALSGSAETTQWEDTLQEVIVVNQRVQAQQESLSSAVTMLRMRQLEQEQRTTYKDLSALVPNLYVPDYGSRMTSSIYMRGLGARIDNPVLGLYIDGIGIAGKNAYDADLYDIRSMQVWRGPQGTLFGRNTIGGVLLIETLSPLDWQGTRAAAGYGNANQADVRLSHYTRLGAKAAQATAAGKQSAATVTREWGLAAAAHYRHTDGFFRNEYDGTKADPADEAGIRLRLDGRNSHGYRNSTSLSYNFVRQGGFPYHAPGQGVNHNDTCAYTRHNFVLGSNYSLPRENYVISGATSYQLLIDRMQMDQDYQPLPYFTLVQAQQEHYVSQEVTLRPRKAHNFGRDSQSSWNWLTGAQLSYKHNRMNAPVHFKQTGIDSLILKNANAGMRTAFPAAEMVLQEDNFIISSRFLTQSVDAAAYHTSYLSFGDWHLEAGLRLNLEYQHFRYRSEGIVHYKVNNTAVNSFREIHSLVEGYVPQLYFEVLPRLAAAYRRPRWQVYASVAEGYKAGGFNTQLFSDILQNTMMGDMMSDLGVSFADGSEYTVSEVITYKPERCLTFEAGISGRKSADEVHLEGTLTLYELEVFNQQLTTFPKRGTGRLMTNAGHSRSLGGEATGSLRWKDLTIQAAYGYTYAFFTRYNNGRQDFRGKRVPYAPEHTLSAGASYRIPFSYDIVSSLILNLNTQAVGPVFWNEENTEVQPFYALLNANITLQMKYVSLTLWGKNLSNTRYDVFRFVSMGNTLLQSGRPISFGGKIAVEI